MSDQRLDATISQGIAGQIEMFEMNHAQIAFPDNRRNLVGIADIAISKEQAFRETNLRQALTYILPHCASQCPKIGKSRLLRSVVIRKKIVVR